jgi:hypothetical protein
MGELPLDFAAAALGAGDLIGLAGRHNEFFEAGGAVVADEAVQWHRCGPPKIYKYSEKHIYYTKG